MSEQFSLAGFDAKVTLTDRLFFAIFPDTAAAAQIARLASQLRGAHALRGKPLATDRFHITLHHIGDYVELPAGMVTAAKNAAATVAMAPFEVVFDRAASFAGRPSNRPFVLRGSDGVAALISFQRALGMAMQRAGLKCGAKSQYTPHVTLLYDDICVAEQAVEPVAWVAREFVLVHSLLGQTRHIPLARWPQPAVTRP